MSGWRSPGSRVGAETARGALEGAVALLGRLRHWFEELTEPDPLLARRGGFVAVALALSIVAGFCYYAAASVATDDALVYFRVARHIQEGEGPVLNAGDTYTPVTSVLWAYLLAWTSTLSGDGDLPAVSRVLGAAFIALSCLLLSLSLRRFLGALAILAPFAVITIPLFRALLGLETPLAILGLCLVHWCYFGLGSPVAAAAALGLAFFCRGDIVLMGVPIGLLVLVDRECKVPIGKRLSRMALVAGAVLVLGLGCQYLATGSLLPATLHTKIIQGRGGPWPTYGSVALEYVKQALERDRWLAGAALFGVLASRSAGASLLATAFLHWGAYSVLSVANYPWYSWLVFLSLRLVTVLGAGAVLMLGGGGLVNGLCRVFRRTPIERSRLVRGCLLVMTLAVVGWWTVKMPAVKRLEQNAAIAGVHYMKTYYEVAATLCPDAADPEEDRRRPAVVLAEEIGMIGFLCPRLEVRDVNGLASPGITLETLNNWPHWVASYEPRYLSMRESKGAELSFPGADGVDIRYQLVVHLLEHGYPVSLYRRVDAEGAPSEADGGPQI